MVTSNPKHRRLDPTKASACFSRIKSVDQSKVVDLWTTGRTTQNQGMGYIRTSHCIIVHTRNHTRAQKQKKYNARICFATSHCNKIAMTIFFSNEPQIDTRSSSRNTVCFLEFSSVNASLTSLTIPRYFQYLIMSSLPTQSVCKAEKTTTIMIVSIKLESMRTDEASPDSRSPRFHLVRVVIAVLKSSSTVDF